MSTDVQRTEMDMSGRVAEEIRALLARRRMSGRELARQLEVSPSWVSYRLTGTQPIDLNDLAMIAKVLGVKASDILSHAERGDQSYVSVGSRPLDVTMLTASTPVRVTGTHPHPGHPVLAGAVTLGERRTSRTGR